MSKLKGTFTALATPFVNGELDVKSFERLLKHQLDAGIDGFVINGTTAESPTLHESERVKTFEIAKSYSAGKATLIMGTGSNSTEKTIEETKKAAALKADAVLVVVPYYNKPPQRGLFQHFKAVAESADIPNILYNVPGRTITALQLETIQSLSKIKNIVGIKEASGNVEFAAQISKICGDSFVLLSGDDGTYVEFLNNGGHGVISVATHVIPTQMLQWKKLVQSGKLEEARADIQKYAKLIDMLFTEANPIPVKKATQMMGVFAHAEMRLPLVEHEEKLSLELKIEMQKLGII